MNKIKKTSTAALVSVFICGMLMSATSTARTVNVGMECTYPPFNFRDGAGNLTGFEVDLANEFAKRYKHDINFVCQEWKGIIPSLMVGKYDIIIGSLSITEKRAKKVDFSQSYRASTGQFVVKKGSNINPFNADGTPNVAALQGKSVGVPKATTHSAYFKAKFPGLSVKQYDSLHAMLLDMTAGRLDAALAGPIKLNKNFLQTPEGKDYEFSGPVILNTKYFGEGVGAAVKKGSNGKLLSEWNQYLDEIYSDGSFKTMNLKYWNFSVLPQVWR
jgi:lysine-arginine-ornithine-binding protein